MRIVLYFDLLFNYFFRPARVISSLAKVLYGLPVLLC